jgi:hypothetical protein
LVAESAFLLMTLAATAAPVVIEGAATCPTPTAVAEQLALRSLKQAANLDRVRVDNDGDKVRIVLQAHEDTSDTSAGSNVVERLLPAGDSCAALARAAAIVIEVWLTERHPEWNVVPVPAPAPPQQSKPMVATLVAPVEANTSPPARTAFTALGGIDAAGDSLAPALTVDAFRWGARYGFGVGAEARWPRTRALGTGSATWTRGALWLGLGRRFPLKRWQAAADLGAGPGLTYANGSGFASNSTRAGVTPVATLGLRADRDVRGALQLVVALRAIAWPWVQTLAADTAAAPETKLPRLSLLLAAGLAW